jgi:hypothetical protein
VNGHLDELLYEKASSTRPIRLPKSGSGA